MKNVTIRSIITCDRTADQWGLYIEMEGIEYVAKVLNVAIVHAVNMSETADEATRKYLDSIHELARYGATDSESIAAAQRIIALAFERQYIGV